MLLIGIIRDGTSTSTSFTQLLRSEGRLFFFRVVKEGSNGLSGPVVHLFFLNIFFIFMIDDGALILLLLFLSLYANDSVIRLCTCGGVYVDAAIKVPFVANPELLLSFMALYVNKNYKDY